jgi:hypothetical protein
MHNYADHVIQGLGGGGENEIMTRDEKVRTTTIERQEKRSNGKL